MASEPSTEPASRHRGDGVLERVIADVRERRASAVDQREELSIERFLQEIERLGSPFDEHADPIHVTGSAVVVGERGLILHLHKRLRMWLQPGGHIDAGETPWEAALRESIEETGLPLTHPPAGVSFLHVDVHEAAKGHTHLDLRYLLYSPDIDPDPGEDESPFVRWFEWDEAIAMADDGLRGLLVALRDR